MRKKYQSLDALKTVPLETLRSYCDIIWQTYLAESSESVKKEWLNHYSEIAEFYLDRKYSKNSA